MEADPSSTVRGILTEGVDSPIPSLHNLFPRATWGNWLLHAATRLPGKRIAVSSSLCQTLRQQFYQVLQAAQQRKGLRVFSLAQKLRRFADPVTPMAGEANGDQVRQWIRQKQAGGYALLVEPKLPMTTTLLDQIHTAIERTLFMMKGFHHPEGNQQAVLPG